jgi:hypothetical protein
MEIAEIARRVAQLKMEHRDLDVAIIALTENGTDDQLRLARLKKRKLALRDEITVLEGQMVPDIIA